MSTIKMIYKVIFIALSAFPSLALAARGGTCNSDFCTFTGSTIAIVLFFAFIVSIVISISEKGFIKGLTDHAGVRFVAMYAAMLSGLGLILITLKNMDASKETTVLIFIIIIAALYIYRK
ncbi:hypothetical protein J7438_23875 [Thalassotalea sp. G20_0]|uniref:hypothetical protein n=1 Tax=Thalassotalea sp. G20_0 TaxID=2821093 RepID=UPI001AD97A2B|nr:hypothetical protein [Thalassotalea sp. G20_0]MBO9497102.1 hypothetical protein [Thalassotalea sp. G20_0]